MKNAEKLKIALAGNPNSGKTSIFNGLTGARQRVANFPGVTVEKRIGHKKYENYDVTFVDLPGTYSLTTYSLDEKVARDYIVNGKPDLIINVIDSCSLERSLYLTLQLIEMGVNIVIDLNMWDEAEESGIKIDTDKLSGLLGTPVVKTIGNRMQGIDNLIETSLALVKDNHSDKTDISADDRKQDSKSQRLKYHRHPPISYGSKLDDIVYSLSDEVSRCAGCKECGNPRWLAVKLLEGDREITDRCLPEDEQTSELNEKLQESVRHIKTTTSEEPEVAIIEGRYGYAAGIVREVLKAPARNRMQFSQSLDNILTHRFLGFPIFFIIMWLIFQATFVIGDYPMTWIENGVALMKTTAANILPENIFANLLIDGIIGGVGSVIIFLPNIVIMFLGISILEDSGYMARAAFLMDRLMHFLGLHGKSFIPMLMGFGCSVPAIMATRTLESQRDRILTILLVPLMSCSARLPVYVLFAGAFFGAAAGNVIFSIYLLGIVLAILMARLMTSTILRSVALPFVMELPPYRWPTGKAVAIHMWERTKIYLKKMGGVILIASILLWALGYFPHRSEYTQDYDSHIELLSDLAGKEAQLAIADLKAKKAAENLEYAYIGRMGKIVDPVVSPLGFNWQMGVSLATGFVAKEVVVSSMGVLYQLGDETDETSESLIQKLQNPDSGITPLAAFAYMAFVLLYTPCIVTIIAVKREIGIRWMWFAIFFQLALAWIVSFIIYQGGKFLGLG